MQGTFTFLGTGASFGVPVVGCRCAVCLSSLKENKRLRASAFIEVAGKKFLIDAGPDFRTQALLHSICELDAFLITHTHFDHVAGIDELRIFTFKQKHAIPCILSKQSFEELKIQFHYLFQERGENDSWFVNMDFRVLEKDRGVSEICTIPFTYFKYMQGNMPVNGFRVGRLAYVTDIKKYPETIFEDLQDVDVLILGAIRESHSIMHFSIEEAVAFARRVGAKETYLTHLSHEIDFSVISAKLPEAIFLGVDGMKIEFGL